MTAHRSENPNGRDCLNTNFRGIVLRYQRRITAFATRMLGGDEAAGQDIAQETFYKRGDISSEMARFHLSDRERISLPAG